jgi:hypothetical protein
MDQNDQELDFTVMEEFDKYVREFTESASLDVPKFDDSLDDLLGLSYEDIGRLTSQDCLARAYKISGYAMYIRAIMNDNRARLNWCEDVLSWLLSKQWNDYDGMIKYDIKRQMIINSNSFAEKIEKLRSRLQARITLLDDKLYDIRKMADIMNEIGRKKSYEHN